MTLRRCAPLCVALSLLLFAPTPARGGNPVLLGLYPWGHDIADTAVNISAVDAWIAPTGQRVGLAGDFLDIEYAPWLTIP